MSDKVVCLGCGLIVDGPGDWGCKCPPPSVAPMRASSPIGEDELPASAPCPRCAARMKRAQFHDATVLDCGGCGGLFLPTSVISALTDPRGSARRLAFPHRDRVPETGAVVYLRCAVCDGLMNRENFGQKSGVIVDVCKHHGIWFDGGEVNAVIAFVERGGVEEAERDRRIQKEVDKARLKEQLVRERRETHAQPGWGRRRSILGRSDDNIVNALVGWLGDV